MCAVYRPQGKCVILTCLAATLLPNFGCIVVGAGLATRVVGDAINDADARDKAAQLRGKDAKAADAILGPRLETLVEVEDPDRMLLIYPVPGQKDADLRYTAEVKDRKITAVSKNKSGDDPKVTAALKDDLLGEDPNRCEEVAKLAEPVLVLRSIERNQRLRVYDSSSLFKGTRYLVLRFDERDACVDIDAVRLRGPSQKGGIIKGR